MISVIKLKFFQNLKLRKIFQNLVKIAKKIQKKLISKTVHQIFECFGLGFFQKEGFFKHIMKSLIILSLYIYQSTISNQPVAESCSGG